MCIRDSVQERYRSYESGIGKRIKEGTTTLEELTDHALSQGSPEVESGRQEYLETIVNNIMFE